MEPGGASRVFFHQLELEKRTPVGYENVVNLIGSTRKKCSDEKMEQRNSKYDKLSPQWNHAIYPRP